MARVMKSFPALDGHEALFGALEKLERALGGESAALRAHIEPPPALASVLKTAIEKMEQLTIEYYAYSRDEITRRTIDPVALSSIEGRWYLDAFCHMVGGPRRFRVSRIRAVQPSGEPVCKDLHGLRAGAPFDDAASTFVEPSATSPDSTVVTLSVHPEAIPIVESFPLESVEEGEDGALTVRVYAGSRVFLEKLLLQLAGYAELIGPPELVGVGRQAAQRVLDRYDSQ